MSNKQKKIDDSLMERAIVTDEELSKPFPFLQENRLLIKRDKVLEKTRGGIIIPVETKEEKEETTVKGTVVLVGPMVDEHYDSIPSARLFNGQLLPKNRITFGKYAGTEFFWRGNEYLILRLDEVFAAWDPKIEDEIENK